MPLINVPLDTLLRLVNADGQDVIAKDRVPEKLHEMGIEVEEVTNTQQYECKVCGKIIERTEAQGSPLNCSNCGIDFRETRDALRELGGTQVVRLDMLAVRPDIFDAGGMARYFRAYLGVQPGLIEYPVSDPKITVRVDPKLSNEDSYRPYIACAVLRNVRLDHELIKLVMNLQEDLHWALGRDRKLASIGVYDLDTLSGETFSYEAVAPDGLKFVPLGLPPDDPYSLITPGEILEKHKTGQAYAHLLKGFSAYPMLRDSEGAVLSMPPIINSESTRVTMDSKQFFVDVTGLSRRTVDRALAVVVTSLKEMTVALEIEQVTIDAPNGRRVTPDLTPATLTLNVREASDTIGVALSSDELRRLLERMGHGVTVDQDDRLIVSVPAWRNDVMHPVDLIEDAAVAYGYDKLAPELVPTFTVGSPQSIEEHSAVARRVMSGLGFHQVMTLVLTSEPAAFEKWRIEPDPRAVKIENPISTEQTICRVSLLPGLLETLAGNKQYDLPQYLFEVGDCCFCDASAETGAREERFVAAAMIGTHVGYADIRAVADAFAHELEAKLEIKPSEHPGFLAGRVAALFRTAGGQASAGPEQIGIMGEVHPEVLENYGLKHPVSVLELSLEKLLQS
ncbi:MAG: phenylalanine--tRNA ligase subunit beta [Phycisphaerae bacterium]